MIFSIGKFSVLLVAMTMSQVTAFTVGGTFLSAAEKAALEETAAAVADLLIVEVGLLLMPFRARRR